MRKWQCLICSFVYEEALGLPDEGIPAGTSWDDIPDDWACPECVVGKEDFEMIEIEELNNDLKDTELTTELFKKDTTSLNELLTIKERKFKKLNVIY